MRENSPAFHNDQLRGAVHIQVPENVAAPSHTCI